MTKTIKRDAEQRLLKGRALLTVFAPFYGTLLHGLPLVECNEGWNPTMATDGKQIFWNRSFVDGLPDDELLYVEAHEVGHPAHLHHTRRGDRDPLLWNMAGDYKINNALNKAGIGKMPKCGLADPRFDPYSTEEVYEILKAERDQRESESKKQQSGAGGQNPKQSKGQSSQASQKSQDGGNGTGQGDDTGQPEQASTGAPEGACGDVGGCGQVIDAAPDEAGKAQAEAETQAQVRQAVDVAMKAGRMPAGMDQIIGELGKAKTDWRETLRRFVSTSSHTDYSWQRPDRRFGWQDLILPGTVSDGVHHVVVARDTSGSLYDGKAQAAFSAEIQALLDEGAVDKITVIDCDAAVQAVAEFDRGDIVTKQAKGGGGTSFKPVWEWLAKQSEAPAAVVYLTDLEPCDGFGDAPEAPVLWAAYGRPDHLNRRIASVPFGEVMVVRS